MAVLFAALMSMASAQQADLKQAHLRQAIRAHFEQEHPVRESPYLTRLAARFNLAGKLVDSGARSATVLPGGAAYVTRGLMTHMQTEAELAGVLAHLASHHETTVVLMLPGGLCSRFSQMGPVSPEREKQADRRAAAMLLEAGFDPGEWRPLDAAPAEGVVNRSEFDRERAALLAHRAPRRKPTLYR